MVDKINTQIITVDGRVHLNKEVEGCGWRNLEKVGKLENEKVENWVGKLTNVGMDGWMEERREGEMEGKSDRGIEKNGWIDG